MRKSRFTPLARATGKYLIQHVYEQVRRARRIDSCIVATDDERIAEAVRSFGGQVAMTRPDHPSGTDRIAEVVRARPELPAGYQGKPFADEFHKAGVPTIPGIIQCALYDTGGEGVAVVYDSVGRDTFLDSVACLRRRGTMVSYGNATGPVAAFDCALLHKAGSVYVTRPGLPDYIASRAELVERAAALFEVVRSGQVRIEILQRYALKDAAQAHRDLEARKTTGSTVLLP